MPGAPNRPPETGAPAPPPVATAPERRVLRRLAPSRVALSLDLWKGAPSSELLDPLERAEAAYSAGEFVSSEKALDQLSVRFAEPRWPTMPAPFKDLRVAIPAPQPPAWNPDHSLEPAEREARRLRRLADEQLALAKATAALAAKRGMPSNDLTSQATAAEAALAANGADDAFWTPIDAFWSAVRERFPMPTRPGARAAPAPAAADAEA